MFERFARMTRPHRILVLAAVTGVLVGLVVAAFEQVVGRWLLEWTLDLPAGARIVAPALGVALAWAALRYVGRGASPALADEYLDAYHRHDGAVPLEPVPGKTLAAGATLGLGGAMGFEGPSIYLGAAIGSSVRRRFPRLVDGRDQRVLLVAGAAAGVAAIFKAPATGAVFAVEVPYQEDSAAHAAVPAIVAAAASYLTFVLFFGLDRLIPVQGNPDLEARELLGALAMGLLAGIGARAFAVMVRSAKRVATYTTPWKRVLGCGLGLVGVAAVTWAVYDAPLSIGPGYGAVEWTQTASRSFGLIVLLLLVRAIATSLTVAAGGAGGIFIPLFVEGWILGAAVEVVVNSNTLLFPVIGAAAFLGAGYRTPIAAIVFVAEATGRPGYIVPALIATGVGQLVMGRQSVTTSQLVRRVDPVELRDRRPVVDAIAPPPESVSPDAPVATRDWTVGQARATLAASGAPYVAVVDGGRVVGIVTAAAILALDD
ncbi:MAG: chloride channel protein [Acidimicrobiia bacterium]|jgi:CIC family chloride channel protein